MEATIRLFRALPIKVKKKKQLTKELLEKTIHKGFIFSPEVIANYPNIDDLIKLVEKEVGLTGEQMNSSFHKSWAKVRDSSIEQLVIEQVLHYFTTYGFEELGIYNESSVYIPNEKLEVPGLEEDLPLTLIKGYTHKELKKKLLILLNHGVALKEQTIEDIVEVADLVGVTNKEIEEIKNKEVRIKLYEELDMIPSGPLEFLRYLVCTTTGKTLLIKNKTTIEEIKECNPVGLLKVFKKYEKANGLEGLASIFYRFKPLFLAFRISPRLNKIINKIRKLAVKHHKPMREDFLNSVTSKIKKRIPFSVDELKQALSKVNTFRKTRLAYALKYRLQNPKSIVYKIRNGKSYATEFDSNLDGEYYKNTLKIVMESITKDISKNVKGKKIFIPEQMTYTIPATEKQFTGMLPSGTYVSIPKDIVVGIYWEDTKGNRIDLDLSMTNIDGKLGWDAGYRNEGKSILFSGDITDASSGASELFYVKRQSNGVNLMHVNYYNYMESVPVPFKILVAKEQVSNLTSNYTVNPNNVVCQSKTIIDKKQKILGLLVTTTKECRFYFSESDMGKAISSRSDEKSTHTRQYLLDFYKNAVSLNQVLEKAGAILVSDIKEADLDLSPENLEKDTILNLLRKNES